MKLKRLLTAALSAVMALSVCALPAMAAGTTAATTPNPVWSQDHGSITIHKYEWNGTNGTHATGEEDGTQLPGDTTTTPSPLKDAEFSLYKVQDAAWLKAYYSGKADVSIQASVFDWNTYAEKDTNGDYKLRTGASVTLVGTKNTDSNGVAKFDKVTSGTTEENLPLGLYLVMETKSPDQVTIPCEPFMVSVPMTRVGATNSQSDWLYDVHVYPKNKTSYGNITLTKKGQVGNSTETATLSGVTFKLYKFVDAKSADGKISAFATTNFTDAEEIGKVWKQIKKSSTSAGDNTGDDFGVDGLLTTGSDGKITVNGLSAGYYCFVEQGVGDANKAFITDQTPHYFEVKGDKSQEVTVATDGTVLAKAGSSAASNLDMTVTDPRPDVEKQVKDRAPAASGEEYVKASDYSVGDDVPYKVTVKVPQALLDAKIKTEDADKFVFEVKDTPEHLAVNNGVKAVKVGGTAVTEGVTITYDTDVNLKGGKGFTAKFTQDALKTLVGSGDTFTIEYTAKLLKGADMTTAGNRNAVSLKYSNKIDADGNIVPGNSSEIEGGSVVYTFGIHVEKRGDTATGTPLTGVKFNVYKEVAAGTTDSVIGSAIGITDAGDKTKSFAKVVIDDTQTDDTQYDLVTGTDGTAKVDGLANGTYYMVETATVDGYNLLSAPVKVEIKVAYAKTWTVVDTYEGGKLTHHRETTNVEYFGGSSGNPKNGFATTTIINRKGFNLPTTGGFGTLLFSGIGVLLVLAGVSVLFSLKKKNNRA